MKSSKLGKTEFQITPATLRDFRAIRSLEKDSFDQDAWPLIEMIGVLTFPTVERWKVGLDGLTVGFVAADVRKIEGLAWIATIAVHPEYRRMGLGNLLMDKAESVVGVARMRLSARASNRGAIRLYQKRGYEQVDVWPAYYGGSEDAIVMEKVLK